MAAGDMTLQQWIDKQNALLPPMTDEDFSRAAAIFASARPAARDDAA